MSLTVTKPELVFAIDGMHCAACVRRATQALERSGSGTVDEVSIGRALVRGSAEDAPVLLAALEKAGFSARLLA